MHLHIDSIRAALFPAAALLACSIALSAAHADTLVYKYTSRDGVTVYSQTLPEDYRPTRVLTIRIETLPVEQQRAAIRMLAAMESGADARLQQRNAQLAKADKEIELAIKNLQQAESNLESGSEPTGADRIGKVGSGTRLRESYFLRVSQLQKAVEQAKLALDQAYRKRNELR